MNHFKRSVSSAALALFAAAALAAQTASDPQSAWEPKTNPGAGQKFLEKLVGDWEVAKSFYPAKGDPIRGKGTCRQHMIHGGRFLESDFVFEGKDGNTTGLGLIGFEPENGRFTSVWTDSRQTRMSMRHSKEPFDGSKIVLYSASLEEPAGGGRASRTVTVLEDGGKRLVHKQYAISPDAPERLMMELVMTRVGGGSAPAR
jgi:hypothetical protein